MAGQRSRRQWFRVACARYRPSVSGQERAAGAYDPQADRTNRLPTAKNLPFRDMDALNTEFGRRGRLTYAAL